MGFSAKQLQALRRSLDHRHVRTREANGRELSYIEGWYAISEANRIFGFDGWNRETVESRCVLARENRGISSPSISPRCALQFKQTGRRSFAKAMARAKDVAHSPGEVHDIALKAAETDATKRALATFGKPFGLELYRKDKKAHPRTLTHPAASHCKSTITAACRFTPRRHDPDSAAVALLRAPTPGLR